MFNLFDELFAPGRKHTEDERNRLELTREDEGSSDPARGPIDLASGTVTVRPPHKAGAGTSDEISAGSGEPAGADTSAGPDASAGSGDLVPPGHTAGTGTQPAA